jgi:hypothetical protein
MIEVGIARGRSYALSSTGLKREYGRRKQIPSISRRCAASSNFSRSCLSDAPLRRLLHLQGHDPAASSGVFP